MFFVLDGVWNSSSRSLVLAARGVGQVIQIEPADAQAFLVAHEWLGIAAGLQGAQERMIHVHGVVAIGVGQHLSDEVTATKSVTMASMPVSSLISRTTVSAGCSPGSLMP